MALSNSTINKLAEVLTRDVIDYICDDDRWVEFMMDVIPDALNDKLGEIDNDLLIEISTCIMDRIVLHRCTDT